MLQKSRQEEGKRWRLERCAVKYCLLDLTIAHMNSQQLWFSQQDLPKIKPVRNLSIGREGLGVTSDRGAMGRQWLLEKGESFFFGGYWYPVNDPHSTHAQVGHSKQTQ